MARRASSSIRATPPRAPTTRSGPEGAIEANDKVTFKVWHEDEHVLVVGKPAKIVTMPGLGHDRSSLLNGLFARYAGKLQKLGQSRDFGVLHRLDKMTSGLVVVALRVEAYEHIRRQFEERSVAKFYWAVVAGQPAQPQGTIRGPIAEYMGSPPSERTARGARTPRGGAPKKLARISSSGEAALTMYRLMQGTPAASLLECRAVTGRLHQVRVHLASIGCPILGDDFYAPPGVRDAASRLALHAHRLVLTHPGTGAPLDVRSTWPLDLRATLKRWKLARPDQQS